MDRLLGDADPPPPLPFFLPPCCGLVVVSDDDDPFNFCINLPIHDVGAVGDEEEEEVLGWGVER